MFSVFLLKPPVVLWNLCADLSIYNTAWFHLVDIKIDSKYAGKKVLDTAVKRKTQNSAASSNLSLLFSFKHNASLEPVNIHYSSAFSVCF